MTSRYPELEEHYQLFETLGSGGFAKVKLGKHKLTGEKVAVKIMNKKQLGDDLPRVYREMRALKNLHHQHVCQLFQVIETDTMIYMILEYCSGGELFDYIVAKERLKEGEARTFFRQIVSALKYVHSSGFIHRDLKPENLLLDEESNIKLIDFGLVAEPQNIKQLLKTCCGSPAYAAPELIKGGPYIGPRADVWSLGVLLYALLNGFLPFDDDNTAELYRLIQIGRYDKPRWLTIGSIEMLNRLLQTIPERRISVDELLINPWVMEGYNRPVAWQSKIKISDLDEECVSELAIYNGLSPTEMSAKILEWRYDITTATYFLLFRQKLSGKHPKIKAPPKKVRLVNRTPSDGGSTRFTITPSSLVYKQKKTHLNGPKEEEETSESDEDEEQQTPTLPPPTEATPAPRSRKISLGQPMHPPVLGEIVSLQKEQVSKYQHPVNPVINSLLAQENNLPKPEKTSLTLPPLLSPRVGSIPESPSFNVTPAPFLTPQMAPKVAKTISYDSRLNRAVEDAESLPPLVPPSPGRRRRFGSVDLVLSRVKKVFKRPSSGGSDNAEAGPKSVKGLFDVNTTSRKSESFVMSEIERVLNEMDIKYTKKNNYTFVCKLDSLMKRGNKKDLEFSLEICLIENLEMIGVKRKRIRGDVWRYKEVCKQIIDATHL